MSSFFSFLTRARGRGALRKRGRPAAQDSCLPAPEDSTLYAIAVCRDEAALGRFIKRLSTLGAEDIQVEDASDQTVCIRMKRPQTEVCWETVVGGLVKRCGLRHAEACPPPADA